MFPAWIYARPHWATPICPTAAANSEWQSTYSRNSPTHSLKSNGNHWKAEQDECSLRQRVTCGPGNLAFVEQQWRHCLVGCSGWESAELTENWKLESCLICHEETNQLVKSDSLQKHLCAPAGLPSALSPSAPNQRVALAMHILDETCPSVPQVGKDCGTSRRSCTDWSQSSRQDSLSEALEISIIISAQWFWILLAQFETRSVLLRCWVQWKVPTCGRSLQKTLGACWKQWRWSNFERVLRRKSRDAWNSHSAFTEVKGVVATSIKLCCCGNWSKRSHS